MNAYMMLILLTGLVQSVCHVFSAIWRYKTALDAIEKRFYNITLLWLFATNA